MHTVLTLIHRLVFFVLYGRIKPASYGLAELVGYEGLMSKPESVFIEFSLIKQKQG